MNQTWENDKKQILGLIWVQICSPNFFLYVLLLLDVIHCCKVSLHAISRESNEPNLRQWQKSWFRARFCPFCPNLGLKFFFSCILSGPDVRYCCKLLLHVISSKTNGRNSEKRQKKPSFAPDFGPFGLNVDHYFFFKKGSCFVSH